MSFMIVQDPLNTKLASADAPDGRLLGYFTPATGIRR